MFRIESTEIREIIVSVLAISIALAVAGGGLGVFFGYPDFVFLLYLLLLTVGMGFILHELAHKFVALSYGASAQFRMWPGGIIMMLALSVFGFLFAAPGAVYISPSSTGRTRLGAKEHGIVSLAGPATNIALMVFFFALANVAPISFHPSQFTYVPLEFVPQQNVWFFGAWINFLLAMFNLLPAFPLDGQKIFSWNPWMWGLAVVALMLVGLLFLKLGYILTVLVFMVAIVLIIKFLVFRR